MGWLRTHFSWLRGSSRRRVISVARTALEQAAAAQDAGEEANVALTRRMVAGTQQREGRAKTCIRQGSVTTGRVS